MRWRHGFEREQLGDQEQLPFKYGKIRVTRDETGLAVDYVNESKAPVPQFGNNDDRVDSIASDLVSRFMQKIRKHPAYRNATHTQSVLTITWCQYCHNPDTWH
jgi:pyruvate-formate lyase